MTGWHSWWPKQDLPGPSKAKTRLIFKFRWGFSVNGLTTFCNQCCSRWSRCCSRWSRKGHVITHSKLIFILSIRLLNLHDKDTELLLIVTGFIFHHRKLHCFSDKKRCFKWLFTKMKMTSIMIWIFALESHCRYKGLLIASLTEYFCLIVHEKSVVTLTATSVFPFQ